MKLAAKPILRRFGFRRVLIVNAAAQRASRWPRSRLFRPERRTLLILAVLLVGGFFRSLQFTSINTLGYADIEPQRMSRATSFASMAQQLSLSAGVGTGAILLHLTMAARGGDALQRERLRAGVPGGRRLRRAVGAWSTVRLPRRRRRGGQRPRRGSPAQER